MLERIAIDGNVSADEVAGLDLDAIRLRRELAAGPERPSLATLVSRVDVDIGIVDPDDLGERLRPTHRAALAGLLLHLAAAKSGRATAVVVPHQQQGKVTIHATEGAADRLTSGAAQAHLQQLGEPVVDREDAWAHVEFHVDVASAHSPSTATPSRAQPGRSLPWRRR